MRLPPSASPDWRSKRWPTRCARVANARDYGPLPVFVALPEPRPGLDPRLPEAVAARVSDRFRGNVTVSVVPQGHAAGGARASAGGAPPRRGAVALGGDRRCRQLHLGRDDRLARSPPPAARHLQRLGLHPRGGGGCLRDLHAPVRPSRASRPLALIEGLGLEQEEVPIKTDGVCLGWGLTRATRSALADLEPERGRRPHLLRPERRDLSRGRARLHARPPGERFRNPADFVAPADCWGDVGAATVPLLIGLVAAAAERGYARGPAQPRDRRLGVAAAAAASSCARRCGAPEPWPSPST